MTRTPGNHRHPWTEDQVAELRRLAAENTPTRVIGLKLGRSPAAVQAKAGAIGLSLKPANRSPWNRRAPSGGRP